MAKMNVSRLSLPVSIGSTLAGGTDARLELVASAARDGVLRGTRRYVSAATPACCRQRLDAVLEDLTAVRGVPIPADDANRERGRAGQEADPSPTDDVEALQEPVASDGLAGRSHRTTTGDAEVGVVGSPADGDRENAPPWIGAPAPELAVPGIDLGRR